MKPENLQRGRAESAIRNTTRTAPKFICPYCGLLRALKHIPFCGRRYRRGYNFQKNP